MCFGLSENNFTNTNDSVHESDIQESIGRLLLIIEKGEQILSNDVGKFNDLSMPLLNLLLFSL